MNIMLRVLGLTALFGLFLFAVLMLLIAVHFHSGYATTVWGLFVMGSLFGFYRVGKA
jgi:hypothetical protein